ncbi:MAG TPA: GtrA family protein [Alphaproteobacteria bacterium]|nr:GtrA family protein [Alphaproteobacteria bacterium]
MLRLSAALRPVRFALVGVGNTLVGLGFIFLGKFMLALPDIPANALGYAAGLAFSFWGNAVWTFEYRGAFMIPAARYAVAFALAYGANLASLVVLTSAGVDGYLAQAASVVPYAATFYLLARFFVFAR